MDDKRVLDLVEKIAPQIYAAAVGPRIGVATQPVSDDNPYYEGRAEQALVAARYLARAFIAAREADSGG